MDTDLSSFRRGRGDQPDPSDLHGGAVDGPHGPQDGLRRYCDDGPWSALDAQDHQDPRVAQTQRTQQMTTLQIVYALVIFASVTVAAMVLLLPFAPNRTKERLDTFADAAGFDDKAA